MLVRITTSTNTYGICVYIFTYIFIGELAAVTNVKRDAYNVTWTPPFSLNITYIEPDIAYCVEVYDITCSKMLLLSNCDVTNPYYFSDLLRDGHIYDIFIIPRNNLRGAKNGIPTELKGS